jgi:hypothetical protein
MWTFKQANGQFRHDGNLVATGYAGRDAGKNNPAMENVKGIGPLPAGRYKAVELIEVHPKLGKYVIHLVPDEDTRKKIVGYGRNPDSFFEHGDSKEHPGLASHGCICVELAARMKFWKSPDDDKWVSVF